MTNVDEQRSGTADATQPVPVAGQRNRRRWLPRITRPMSFALAVLFFFGPALAYATGVRAKAIENRPLRSLPGLSAGWSFFADMSAWSIDHLPLRDRAVNANVTLSEKMFGEPPSYGNADTGPVNAPPVQRKQVDTSQTNQDDPRYPRVVQGTDGWLYLGADVTSPCDRLLPVDEIMSRLNRLATAVERSGRTFVFTVAPDKGTVWPRNLPAEFRNGTCVTARKDQLWAALRSNPPSGYFDMRGPIEARQRQTGQPVYWKSDTHWGQFAAATYAVALASHVDPTGFGSPPSVSCHGTVSHSGDLGVVLGQPRTDTLPACRIDTPTPITATSPVVPVAGEPDFHSTPLAIGSRYSRSLGRPAVQAPTLLLGDSFSSASRSYLFPLFSNLQLQHNEEARYSTKVAADAMVGSKVVAYEIVERALLRGPALLDDAALTAIEQALQAHPYRR